MFKINKYIQTVPEYWSTVVPKYSEVSCVYEHVEEIRVFGSACR